MGTFRDFPYILVFLIFLTRASARRNNFQVTRKDNASHPLSGTFELYPANGYDNDTNYYISFIGKENPLSIVNVTLLDVDINEDSLKIFGDDVGSVTISPTFNGTDGICTTYSNPILIVIWLQTNFNPGRGLRIGYTMESEGGPYLPAGTGTCTVPDTDQETTPNQPTTPQESISNQPTTPPTGSTILPDNGKCNLKYMLERRYVGGPWYNSHGSGSNPVCLSPDPIWDHYNDNLETHAAYIYGAEYELVDNLQHLYNENVPCAVCLNPTAVTTLMIPGRNKCYPGWNEEYHGYLVANRGEYLSGLQYTCLDDSPDVLDSGHANQDGVLFVEVEGRCGSLPCPPYVNGREITCVVCSR